jgi:hypothetical protein
MRRLTSLCRTHLAWSRGTNPGIIRGSGVGPLRLATSGKLRLSDATARASRTARLTASHPPNETPSPARVAASHAAWSSASRIGRSWTATGSGRWSTAPRRNATSIASGPSAASTRSPAATANEVRTWRTVASRTASFVEKWWSNRCLGDPGACRDGRQRRDHRPALGDQRDRAVGDLPLPRLLGEGAAAQAWRVARAGGRPRRRRDLVHRSPATP